MPYHTRIEIFQESMHQNQPLNTTKTCHSQHSSDDCYATMPLCDSIRKLFYRTATPLSFMVLTLVRVLNTAMGEEPQMMPKIVGYPGCPHSISISISVTNYWKGIIHDAENISFLIMRRPITIIHYCDVYFIGKNHVLIPTFK